MQKDNESHREKHWLKSTYCKIPFYGVENR